MSALDNLKELLNKPVRVVLLDGRVIQGNLHCMDKDLNFIISEAQEFHGVGEVAESFDLKDAVVRHLGSAMVPGIHVIKVLALSQ